MLSVTVLVITSTSYAFFSFPYKNNEEFKNSIRKNYPEGSDAKLLREHLRSIGMIEIKDKHRISRYVRALKTGEYYWNDISDKEITDYYDPSVVMYKYKVSFIFTIEAQVTFIENKSDGTIKEYRTINRVHKKGS